MVDANTFEIRGGASPSIVGNLFQKASTNGAQPSAALRVYGASKAEIRGNRFENNQQYPIYLDAAADARLSGNRLEYNAYNAVLLAGSFTGATSLSSLGPRRYAYHVRSVMSVKDGASLAIAPGATFQFFSGSGLTVDGRARGASCASRTRASTTTRPPAAARAWSTPSSGGAASTPAVRCTSSAAHPASRTSRCTAARTAA
jgi:hypothetical protein